MKNGLVIADSGPVFSLAVIDKLGILTDLFDDVKIPRAVWDEIRFDNTKPDYHQITDFFSDKVCEIKGINELTFVMDYGESEALILYKELHADFLLIDDKKARRIAESLKIKCIGIIGLLSVAKDKGLIDELKPLFETLLLNKRFYSIDLINSVLLMKGEEKIVIVN